MTIEHFLGVCLDLHYVPFTEKGQGPAQVPKSRMDSRAGPPHHGQIQTPLFLPFLKERVFRSH